MLSEFDSNKQQQPIPYIHNSLELIIPDEILEDKENELFDRFMDPGHSDINLDIIEPMDHFEEVKLPAKRNSQWWLEPASPTSSSESLSEE